MKLISSVWNLLLAKQPARVSGRGRARRTLTYSDDQIVEMRRLHEQEGWGPTEIAKHFNCPISYTRQILYYLARTGPYKPLEPKEPK